MKIQSFLPIILVFIIGSLNAQSRVESFPDRASNPRVTKFQKQKRLDVFAERSFKSFFTFESNLGLSSTFGKDLTKTLTAPISFGVNYRVSPTFSIGAQAGLSRYASDINYYDKRYKTSVETTSQLVNLRLNAHFPVGLRGEAFGGLGLGYRGTDVMATEAPQNTEINPEPIIRPQNGFLSTAHIGGRYSLTPRLGLQGELSSGISLVTFGISLRLR